MTFEEKQELQSFFDARYVRKDTCAERQEQHDKRFADNDTRTAITTHDLAAIKKILWFIAGILGSQTLAGIIEHFMN